MSCVCSAFSSILGLSSLPDSFLLQCDPLIVELALQAIAACCIVQVPHYLLTSPRPTARNYAYVFWYQWLLFHILLHFYNLLPIPPGSNFKGFVQSSTPEWYTTPFWYTFVYVIASPNDHHFFFKQNVLTMYTYQQVFHKISSWLNKFWFHSKMFKSGCFVDFAENILTPQWYTHIL